MFSGVPPEVDSCTWHTASLLISMPDYHQSDEVAHGESFEPSPKAYLDDVRELIESDPGVHLGQQAC